MAAPWPACPVAEPMMAPVAAPSNAPAAAVEAAALSPAAAVPPALAATTELAYCWHSATSTWYWPTLLLDPGSAITLGPVGMTVHAPRRKLAAASNAAERAPRP